MDKPIKTVINPTMANATALFSKKLRRCELGWARLILFARIEKKLEPDHKKPTKPNTKQKQKKKKKKKKQKKI